MNDEREIGRIIFVDSFRVMAEIDKDIKSLTKSFYTGVHPVAQINSYIVIPVGSQEIVAIVTKVTMTEETKEISTKTSITLPESKRLLYATMIGRIENEEYYQGITSFPSLSNPVWSVSPKELDIIFDKTGSFRKDENKSYYISVGESASFPGYEIKIDPDALFSKHLAVLGNTGSGKSCTIASLIQAILFYKDKEVKNAHFVILDTNSEYKRAFEGKNGKKIGNYLYIGSDNLKIPYWFMNFDDFVHLFDPKEGVQMPVLGTALSLAKKSAAGGTKQSIPLSLMKLSLDKITTELQSDKEEWKIRQEVSNKCDSILGLINEKKESLKDSIKLEYLESLEKAVTELKRSIPADKYKGIDDTAKNKFLENYESINHFLSELVPRELEELIDVNIPSYFKKKDFLKTYFEDAMKLQEQSYSRISEYCATLKVRINRFFSNDQYKFIFEDFENHPWALATFLRYTLGMFEKAKYNPNGNPSGIPSPGIPPYLKKEDIEDKEKYHELFTNHQVVIIDLNLLASEILENITALLGRLILEFLQRVAKHNKDLRGKFPVVLVLEEAHNYIPEKTKGDNESASKIVFERIAREGRKFGLSLVVASQRPSELSRTVLAQCNSFIVHRIQNPEDQEYIRKIVPSVNEDILRQLPALAQQTALIFGDCVRSPALLKIRQAEPYPRGDDPKFFAHWIGEQKPEEPPFEEVCKKWEGD
ncbi:MAG: DUF87 domain-containing protein [Patescibacteria group bacterium]